MAEQGQLARLRAMAHAGASRRPTSGAYEDHEYGSLHWAGTRVAWQRGARLVQSFSYAEPVRAASTALLERGGGGAERAICVMLERTAVFYFPRLGEEYVQPLPFRLAAVHPLALGVLLVREREPEDRAGGEGLPMAFYLRSVFDDLAKMIHVPAISGIETPTLHGAAERFLTPDEQIVYAARSGAPLLITARRGAIRIYAYATAREPMAHDAYAAPPPRPRKSRRSSALRRGGRRSSVRDASDMHLLAELEHAQPELASVLEDERRPSLQHRSLRQRKSSLAAAEHDTEADTPLFEGFAHAHAAAALLEEIRVPELQQGVACTTLTVRGEQYVYMAVAAARRAFARVVSMSDRVSVRAPSEGDAVLVADHVAAVCIVEEEPDALLVRGDGDALHCGPPGHGTAAILLQNNGLCVRPACALTRRVLEALLASLPRPTSSTLLARWAELCGAGRAPVYGTWATLERLCGVQPAAKSSDAYTDLLADRDEPFLSRCLGTARQAPRPRSAPPLLDAHHLPGVAVVLHFLAQDAALDTLRRRTDAPRIVHLLLSVCRHLGWASWVDYWQRRIPSVGGLDGEAANVAPPPDLYALLRTALERPVSLHDTYLQCAAMCGVHGAAPLRHCERSADIFTLFSALGGAALRTPGVGAAQQLVQTMLDLHWDASVLGRLPPGIALPLEEVLRTCQLDPPKGWAPEAYTLLRRLDASAQASPTTQQARVHPSLLRTLPDASLDPLCAQLFSKDYRLSDVARMLQTTSPNAAHIAHDDERDELEHHAELLQTARTLAERTMAQCIGRGMFRMASRALRPTATWRTPRLCLALRTYPGGALFARPYAADPHEVEWPEFHNGVASALEIAVHADERIDSNWIFAHSTAQRDAARHAGFLLGLGLHGHLARLGRVHAYRYLTPRHALTTVGLVLGVAASFLGTADPAARQVMAIQVAAFLPHRSIALHFSPLTQAAGLLGMGLVFCQTDHRWTAERLAAQLEGGEPGGMQDMYANAAGLGLGFVLLGRGRRTPMDSASDVALLAQLRRLLLGTGAEAPAANRAMHAATLALALVFLRSERKDIAQLVAPPPNAHALEHLRPDLLLVRTLAHALILWSDIAPDEAWLQSTLAPFMHGTDPGRMRDATQLAWYNMRAGACLALSLRYAGTGDARARALLLRQLQDYVHDAVPSDDRYASRVAHAARETLRDVLHVALATVMAGTGDVELLRLYRVAHGATSRSYGSHMAAHMALGLLFLGGGRFTLGTGDVAIAAMLAAFLPRYPAGPGDCRAHLQAARHLYVLALAPRLLVARDVRSNEVCFLPVSVSGRPKMYAPTLLPPLEGVHSVQSASRRYWPTSLDANAMAHGAHDPRHIHWFHVQRRTGYLSYVDDPHGHRSIFARSRGWAAHPFSASTSAEAHAMLRDLRELVQSFETAPQDTALVRRVCCGTRPFQVFCTAVLMECLTADTPALAHVYFALYDGVHSDDAWFVQDLQLLEAFYSSAASHAVRDGREALLSPTVLSHLRTRLAQRTLPSDALAYLAGHGASLSPRGAVALAAMDAPLGADLDALRAKFTAMPYAAAAEVLRRVLLLTSPLAPREKLLDALLSVWK